MYLRIMDFSATLKRKSVFLFGPRQTGKSYLLKHRYPDAPYYDLLKSDLFFKLAAHPELLREQLLDLPENSTIIIDEIQKLPVLLDEVHYLIENKNLHFVLTGSSARKLKYGASNLLGGRAITWHLFPLVSAEIPDYNLERIVNWGSLPSVYDSPEPIEDLEAYVGTYLQEEIVAEGIVRKLEHFSKFLEMAALSNTEILNYSNIAGDLGMPAKTVREYFQILQDTLLGSVLEPYYKTVKRKAISTAKFYFFDIGVSNVLSGRFAIKPKSDLFGKAFEHFIYLELKAYLHYKRIRDKLTFWRSTGGYEVDFVIGDHTGIEVKGADNIQPKHLKGLRALGEEVPLQNKIIVSLIDHKQKKEDIVVYPYREFLSDLWSGEIFSS